LSYKGDLPSTHQNLGKGIAPVLDHHLALRGV